MPATVGYALQKLTRAHRKDVEALWEDVLVGQEFRKHREILWRRSEKQYQGNTGYGSDDTTSDLVNVNVSFSTANTIMPHITGREPEFMVIPFSKDATSKNARIQQAFLNRKWRHKAVGAQKGLKAAGFDYIIYGDGYLKTTWSIIDRPIGVDEVSTIVEEHVDRLSPWDVWIDPNSTGIADARWVAIRLWLTEDEARQDESYKIPAGYQFTTIDPTKNDDDSGEMPYHATQGGKRKWVVLFELYDVTNKIMYVVPGEGDKMPWKVIEGITIPVEQIGNYIIPQSPYHMGDLEQIYSVQVEIDKTRSQLVTHRKRNVSKILIKKDSMTPEAISAMQSSVVGEMVPIKGDGLLTDLVAPVQLAPLAGEVYESSRQAQQDVYEITGISEYQRGTAPDITRTATEAQIMQGSANVKLDAKLNTIEEALRNVGEYLLAIARDVYPETDVNEMAMFIGGADGRAINQLQAGEDTAAALENDDRGLAEAIAGTSSLFGESIITPDEEVFVGTYEVMVDHSSTDALSPKVRAEKFRAVAQMLLEFQPVLQATGTNIDMARMVRLWLEAEGIPGVDALLSGAPPPPPDPNQPTEDPLGAAQGGPQGIPPGLLEALQAAPPDVPIGPDNSGALDPDAYPLVGR